MAVSAPSISRQRRRLSRIWFPRHNCRAPLRLVRRSAMSPRRVVMAGVLISLLDRHVYGVLLGLLVRVVTICCCRGCRRCRGLATISGITYVRTTSIVLGAIGIDLSLSWLAALSHYCRSMRRTFSRSVLMRFLRAMPAFGAVVAGVVLSSLTHAALRSEAVPALAVFRGRLCCSHCRQISGSAWLPCLLWRRRHDQRQYPHDPCPDGDTRSSSRAGQCGQQHLYRVFE